MLDKKFVSDGETSAAQLRRLQGYHLRSWHSPLLGVAALFVVFVIWAMNFHIDEVTQAHGEVIASSRVQVIQAVDGGVLLDLLVKEGDRVKPGQVLARLDPARLNASVGETDARVAALKARAVRLRAEVVEAREPVFSNDLKKRFPETVAVELALFTQRRYSLREDVRVLKTALDLAKKEQALVTELHRNGDASGTELLRVERGVNDAETRLIGRQNKFLEDARAELAKAEDDMAQNGQVLNRRLEEQQAAVFVAQVPGIVKNIRVTTVGGVLKAGEEILQIVPVDDALVLEAKVKPSDIARIRPDLPGTIRFDPFDYTIFGSVTAKVIYVSADTLKEETKTGTETYYRVHLVPTVLPVQTTTGKSLTLLPGMTAQVDIRTGERTLMAYLLKPIRKTLTESLGER